MIKNFRAITILIFILFTWVDISAQVKTEHVVYLNNGSVIRGKILYNKNDSVKIETRCRNIFVFNNSLKSAG